MAPFVGSYILLANIVTSSKALVTTSVALVTTSTALVTTSVALVITSVALVITSTALVTRSDALVTRRPRRRKDVHRTPQGARWCQPHLGTSAAFLRRPSSIRMGGAGRMGRVVNSPHVCHSFFEGVYSNYD